MNEKHLLLTVDFIWYLCVKSKDFENDPTYVTLITGRFLKFRRYHNFANLFSKLSETTFYKEISKFQ